MRPISIRFQAFGPYLKEQVLEFSRLENGGLFLICGETGAGKTTILDAMSYALYNRSSGSLRGRGLEVMRCKLAGPEDDTVVEFDFASGGRQYRFRRSMRMLRKNFRDDHQCWELREGDWVPLFENPKEKDVSELAERLLGLTYEQFRQVMLLPQGQFEKLLVSDSEEKEKILVSLFGTGRWDRIAGEIAERVKLRADALEQEKRTLRARLQVFGCDTPEALAEQAVQTRQEVEALEAQCRSGGTGLEALRKQAAAALEALRAFRQLDEARAAYELLHGKQEEFDRLGETLNMAARAEALQPDYEEVKRAALAAAEVGCRSAHYNAYYHAALLLAYKHGGDTRYLDMGRRGLETLMSIYPETRREQSETEEMCRLVLPLAVLYDVTREETHREMLYRVVRDLQTHKHPSGGYREWDTGYKASCSRESSGECSLLTENGDPVADLLYSTNWLPIGFAYAYYATGDEWFRELWRDVVRFCIRSQVISEDATIDGAWCRAFDMDMGEVYSCPHDTGWASCACETGWTIAEILMGMMFMDIMPGEK